jgi:NADH-quinone oxidoreductase subunit H
VSLPARALLCDASPSFLADRKIWAAVQMRRGPNVVGAFGLLQTFADALKFFLKEVIIPAGANKVRVPAGAAVTFVLAFAAWAVIPSTTAG